MNNKNWDGLKNRIDRIPSLSPAEREALRIDLQSYQSTKQDDSHANEAKLALEILSTTTLSDGESVGRKKGIDSIKTLIDSPQLIDVKRGIETCFSLLEKYPEDTELFDILISVAARRPNLIGLIEARLQVMERNGSPGAKEALTEILTKSVSLPKVGETTAQNSPARSIQELLEKADDAYYAADYDQARLAYHEILKLDPQNIRAKEQLEKAQILRGQERLTARLPREAVQSYRRARSFINARAVKQASILLQSAVETAGKAGMAFPEAEVLLYSLENAVAAAEFKASAKDAMRRGEWGEAVQQLDYALNLDSTDPEAQALRKQITELRAMYDKLRLQERAPGSVEEQIKVYKEIRQGLSEYQENIAVELLYDELTQRVSVLSENIKTQLVTKAVKAFQQAEQTPTLAQKSTSYNLAVQFYDEAVKVDPLFYDERQALAGDRAQQVNRVMKEIDELKTTNNFPQQVDEISIKYWSQIAPDDLDVRNARAYLDMKSENIKNEHEKIKSRAKSRRGWITLVVVVSSIGVLLTAIIGGVYTYGRIASSMTPTATMTLPPTYTLTPSPPWTNTPTSTITPTYTPTLTPTITHTPTPTATPRTLGIVTAQVGLYDSPNGNQIGVVFPNQVVIVLETRQVGKDIWYHCTWVINGLRNEGWIKNAVTIINPEP